MLSFSFVCTQEDSAAGRLDKAVLARAKGASRAQVADCFSDGGVWIAPPETSGPNPPRRRRAAKSDRPIPGFAVFVDRLETADDVAVAPEPDATLRVVWSDANLVALDKPAGQPCNPIAAGETGTLASAIVARFPETSGVGPDPREPGLLHRIDAGTSGLVLAARNQASWEFVRRQFAAQAVKKTYLARVIGRIDAPGGASGFLAHCPSNRGKMRPVSGSALPGGERPMRAETFWTPLSHNAETTLLRVEIRTGVTHQIRCQLAAAGHPVAGDTLYGAPEALSGPRGPWHMLHSLAAALTPPSAAIPREIRAPPPLWAE